VLCSAISTSATAQAKKVILDSIPAHKVISDLIGGDVAKAELKISRAVNADKTEVIKKQVSVIDDLKTQKTDLFLVVQQKDGVIATQNEIISNDKKIIVREKTKKTFWEILSGSLLVLIGYLVIK
jgi:hypothetical protein